MAYLCYLLWFTEGGGDEKTGRPGKITLFFYSVPWVAKGAFMSCADGIHLNATQIRKQTMFVECVNFNNLLMSLHREQIVLGSQFYGLCSHSIQRHFLSVDHLW